MAKCDECGRDVDLVTSFEVGGRKTPQRCKRCLKKAYARIREQAKRTAKRATK